MLAPLIVEKEAVAVVEIFQRPGGGPTTQRGYLRFLVQMCDVACDYLKGRRLKQLAQSQDLWRQLEGFVSALHRSLDAAIHPWQYAGIAGAAGALVAAANAWVAWGSENRGFLGRIKETVLALACIGFAWFAWSMHLLDLGLRY